MVSKSTDEAQEATEEAEHERQRQFQFGPAIDICYIARW